MCYNATMTEEQIAKVLKRVRKWPQKRQKDAARILIAMEHADTSPYHLTDEQVEEVKRRRRDLKNGKARYATEREMAALWKKCGL